MGSRILGDRGDVMPGDMHCPARGRFSPGVMTQLPHKIGAGTSEIQRDIVAQAGARLPRAQPDRNVFHHSGVETTEMEQVLTTRAFLSPLTTRSGIASMSAGR